MTTTADLVANLGVDHADIALVLARLADDEPHLAATSCPMTPRSSCAGERMPVRASAAGVAELHPDPHHD
jgi:hypothetical protein